VWVEEVLVLAVNMWRAMICRTPVLQTVKKAAAGSRRSLADTTSPLSQQATATAAALDRTRELKPSGKNKYMVMDGNEAAAYVAYSMSDISFIYPISPATSMGEHMDKWAAGGKKNILGQVCLFWLTHMITSASLH